MMIHKDAVFVQGGLVILVLAITCWGSVSDVSAKDEVKTAPDVIIYDGKYPAWPWIARTPNGRLLCVWREGTKHMYSDLGKIMLSQSIDNGRTWSAAHTIIDAPYIDDRNTAIMAISDNTWLLCYNSFSSDSMSRTLMSRTSDGGFTWSVPMPISSLDARTRAAPIEIQNGRLILPYYLAPGNQSLAAISDDNGQTWITIHIPNTMGFVGDEWSLVELPDHSLAGICRNNAPDSDGSLWITKSIDQGLSWTNPAKTNLRDTRMTSPAQIFLQEGKPWVMYDDIRMVSVALATTCDPDLIVWNVDQRIQAYRYRSDDKMIEDGGYPCSVALSDNRRFIVDYLIDGNVRAIVGYYITISH